MTPAVVGVGSYAPARRPPADLRGTGFVVGDGSRVVTNHHVIDFEPAARIKEELVVFVGRGRQVEYRHARIVARDAEHDLALLAIVGPPLPALRFASAPLRVGEEVAFTGYPLGAILGLYPVTHQGMVSALPPLAIPATTSRDLSTARLRALRDPFEVIQLDATAYPGNSGSPLYRRDSGELVGVLNQVFVKGRKENVISDPSGITYAIPARYIAPLLEAR